MSRKIFIILLICGVLLTLYFCINQVMVKQSEGTRRAARSHRDVKMQLGTVRGWMAEDGDYFAFLGIPYAAPPTGKNRFKAPLPVAPWKNIFYANREVKCPQRGKGEEDCLIVNVFTPVKKFDEPLPVLIYIHGGSFIIGGGQTKGVELLIEEDIIVVTMNYRLGVLGFLCLGIEDAPGNAGLKDQKAALQWVQDNIANFGGRPDMVTLYGMSAGSSSVEFHILSKASKGLFQKAIMESGSATSVFALDPKPVETAVDFAVLAKFPEDLRDFNQLVEHYQKMPADILSEISYDYYYNFTDGTFGFVPCVENYISDTDYFLIEPPKPLLLDKSFKTVPIMMMFTTLEGLYLFSEKYYESNYKERMESNFADFLPADLEFENSTIKRDIAERVKQFYFGNETIGDGNIISFLNYFGDYLILHGLINSAKQHSRDNNRVYLMEFAYKGDVGSYEEFYKHLKIAGHGDIIKHVILEKDIEHVDDLKVIDKTVRIIANYVKYSDPTAMSSDLLPIGVTWPPVGPQLLDDPELNYLLMNKTLQVLKNPYNDRIQFWDQLYSEYGRQDKQTWA